MGKYVPKCPEEQEFNDLLRKVNAPTNLNDCAAINTFVRAKLKMHQLWVVERVGWRALSQIVGGEEESSPKPLLAARILLGLYEYPSDPTMPFGPDKPPLREYWPNAPTLLGPPKQKRVLGLTVRQKIAAAESGLGSGNDLSGNSRKLPIVSEAVWLAFAEHISGLTDQQARQLIKEAKASGPAGGVVKVVKSKRGKGHAPESENPEEASVPDEVNTRSALSRWFEESRFTSWLTSMFGMVSIATLAAVMTAVAFIFLPSFLSSPLPPVTETKVLTYAPTLSEIAGSTRDADELPDATCAPSYSSLRRDAYSCAVDMDVRRFLDPCFEISTDRISCPNAMDIYLGTGIVGIQARVTKYLDAAWSSSDGRFGINHAEESPGPWIFLLERTSDAGLPLMCRAALVQTVKFDGPTYNCATANKFPEILASTDNEIFSSASYVGVGYLDQIVAGDLDQTTEPWTVEVVDPARNTTERVAVRGAWF